MKSLKSFFVEKGFEYMHRFLHHHPEPSGQMLLTPLYVQQQYFEYSGERLPVHELLNQSSVLINEVKAECEKKIIAPKPVVKVEKTIQHKAEKPVASKVKQAVSKVKQKVIPLKKKKK
jgi:hypothetical protein